MKKIIIALTLITAGCTPSQWASFVKDSPAYIAAIENDVQTALAIANTIFTAILPLLSSQDQAKVTQDYTASVQVVLHCEAALNDAAAAARTSDIAVAVVDLQKAAAQLLAVIDEVRSLAPKTAAASKEDSYQDLVREQRTISRY